MSIFDTAQAWLRTQRTTHAAKSITYTRASESNSVKATRGQSEYDTDDGVTITKSKMVDWIVDKADLTLGGTETKPEVDDQITDEHGHIYRVAPMGQDPHFREHGSDGLSYRIHSVRVA